jgi:hypothetical protein
MVSRHADMGALVGGLRQHLRTRQPDSPVDNSGADSLKDPCSSRARREGPWSDRYPCCECPAGGAKPGLLSGPVSFGASRGGGESGRSRNPREL